MRKAHYFTEGKEIVDGPTKWELMLGLFVPGNKVVFKTKCGQRIEVSLREIAVNEIHADGPGAISIRGTFTMRREREDDCLVSYKLWNKTGLFQDLGENEIWH